MVFGHIRVGHASSPPPFPPRSPSFSKPGRKKEQWRQVRFYIVRSIATCGEIYMPCVRTRWEDSLCNIVVCNIGKVLLGAGWLAYCMQGGVFGMCTCVHSGSMPEYSPRCTGLDFSFEEVQDSLPSFSDSPTTHQHISDLPPCQSVSEI